VISAHGGGFLPSYAPRSDYACEVSPINCTVQIEDAADRILKKLYYDALVFTPEALRHIVAQVGASQLMLAPITRFRGRSIRSTRSSKPRP